MLNHEVMGRIHACSQCPEADGWTCLKTGCPIDPSSKAGCPLGKWDKLLVIGPSRGLGDTVAKITAAIGIKPCGGCKGRQDALNRMVPYEHKD